MIKIWLRSEMTFESLSELHPDVGWMKYHLMAEWRLDDGLYFREEPFMMSFIILQNWIFRSFKKDAESFLRVWFCIFFLYKNKICVFSFVLSKNCITFASCFWFLPGNLIRDDGKSCWAVSESYRLNAAKSSRTRNILNRSDEKVHYRS